MADNAEIPQPPGPDPHEAERPQAPPAQPADTGAEASQPPDAVPVASADPTAEEGDTVQDAPPEEEANSPVEEQQAATDAPEEPDLQLGNVQDGNEPTDNPDSDPHTAVPEPAVQTKPAKERSLIPEDATRDEIAKAMFEAWEDEHGAEALVSQAVVENYWDTSTESLTSAVSAKGLDPTSENIELEKQRRSRINQSIDKLQELEAQKAAIEAKVQAFINEKFQQEQREDADGSITLADRVRIANTYETDISALREKHMKCDENGVYTFLDDAGELTTEIPWRQYVHQIYQGLIELAMDPTHPARIQAIENWKILDGRVVTLDLPGDQPLECFFDTTPGLEHMIPAEITQLGWDTLDTALTKLGGLPRTEDDEIDADLLQARLKELYPNGGSISQLSILMLAMDRVRGPDPKVNNPRDTERLLSVLISEEISMIDLQKLPNGASIGQKVANHNTRFSAQLNEAYGQLNQILTSLGGLPEGTKILPRKLMRNMVFAYVCETGDGLEENGSFVPDLTELFDALQVEGEFSQTDKDFIWGLAQSKNASIALEKVLGFDLELLTNESASEKISSMIGKRIAERRSKYSRPEMNEEGRKNAEEVLELIISLDMADIEGATKPGKLKGMLSSLSLLALMLSPQLAQLLGTGAEKDEQER